MGIVAIALAYLIFFRKKKPVNNLPVNPEPVVQRKVKFRKPIVTTYRLGVFLVGVLAGILYIDSSSEGLSELRKLSV